MNLKDKCGVTSKGEGAGKGASVVSQYSGIRENETVLLGKGY